MTAGKPKLDLTNTDWIYGWIHENIAAQMVNFDREQMRRIANNMPEQYDEKATGTAGSADHQRCVQPLLATFPASLANRDQNELNNRRQWEVWLSGKTDHQWNRLTQECA